MSSVCLQLSSRNSLEESKKGKDIIEINIGLRIFLLTCKRESPMMPIV
jgi:hypothetical protein